MAQILLADDEDTVRAFVQRALEADGHEVRGVSDGGQALDALGEKPFDLLLSDIVMPVMDGISLALTVASSHPDVRVLLMTGYPGEQDRARNLDRLIDSVISKPFTLAEIQERVRCALDEPSKKLN